MKPLPTQSRLKELLSYDPETGVFRWLVRPACCIHIGDIAGMTHKYSGYKLIRVDGQKRLAHRLAWVYVYGVEPDKIDHINCIPGDNRIANLRNVSVQVNNHNRTRASRNNKSTGLLGASVDAATGRFRALIRVNGRLKSLGTFGTPEEAHECYVKAKRIYHPEGCTL